MIFAIPIELKVREFTSKVYLSYKSFLDQSKNITLYQEQGYLNSRGSW